MEAITNNAPDNEQTLRIKEIIAQYKETEKPPYNMYDDDDELYQANLEYNWFVADLQEEMDMLRVSLKLPLIPLHLFK